MKLKIVKWLGNFCGKVIHAFKGCGPFWAYHKNKKGKPTRRWCRRCGQTYDRQSGTWKFVGRYLISQRR